jgi:hypothetical protein
MGQKWAVLLPALVLLSACTTRPVGPNVLVLPGAGKPFDHFQVDDGVCRQVAQQQIGGGAPGQASTQATLSGAAIGTVVGAAVGAAIGAAAGRPEVGAAVGAGTGLLTGTATAAESAGIAAGGWQWRYDAAYVQCMYTKGNQVPGVVSVHQVRFGPPPPPPPAPSPSQTPPSR